MNVKELLKEYDLGIDDVRWYLATVHAKRLLQYRDNEFELIRYIWSGALDNDLYEMEERLITGLQSDYDRGFSDEGKIREVLKEISDVRTKRYSED